MHFKLIPSLLVRCLLVRYLSQDVPLTQYLLARTFLPLRCDPPNASLDIFMCDVERSELLNQLKHPTVNCNLSWSLSAHLPLSLDLSTNLILHLHEETRV